MSWRYFVILGRFSAALLDLCSVAAVLANISSIATIDAIICSAELFDKALGFGLSGWGLIRLSVEIRTMVLVLISLKFVLLCYNPFLTHPKYPIWFALQVVPIHQAEF
jgi:hypothetical protein